MTGLLLSLPAYLGYVLWTARVLKISPALSPLFCSCGLMLVLFWMGLGGGLWEGKIALLAGGWFLAGFEIFRWEYWRRRLQEPGGRNAGLLFGSGLSVILFCSLSGYPSVVDDYSFWAIIGKSLISFNSFPGIDTSIFPRHLSYTPGLALFQYFFHGLVQQQSLYIAYVAQNLLLLSVLLAIGEGLKRVETITLVSAAFILLVIFSGSVLQKLRADHFLYSLGFIALWLYMAKGFEMSRLAVICITLPTLYLVKEVGLLVSGLLVVYLVVDILRRKDLRGRSTILALGGCGLAASLTILGKIAWDSHCMAAGFHSFHQAVTVERLAAPFDVFGNESSRRAAAIFLRELVIGAADGLKSPYCVWYYGLFLVARKTYAHLDETVRSRYLLFFKLGIPFYLLYVVMNYIMQYTVFGLGDRTLSPPSLSRYLNIFFGCGALLILLMGLRVAEPLKRTVRRGLVGVAALIVLVTSWPDAPQPFELEISGLGEKMRPMLQKDSRVCITPGRSGDHYPGFRLLYLEFPVRFNVDPFPAIDGRGTGEQLNSCDFVLVYRPEAKSNILLQPFAEEPLNHGTFFSVVSGGGQDKVPRLKRMF